MISPLKRSRSNVRSSTMPGGIYVRVPPRQTEAGMTGTSRALRYDYFVLEAGQIVDEGRAALAELPARGPLILVVAAADVLLTEAVVPPLSGRQLRDALPNLIEDRALSDVAGLHVAQMNATQPQSLAVVNRAWLNSLIARFANAGLRVTQVWPESLCTPWISDSWSLACVADAEGISSGISSFWLRTSAGQSYALPHAEADLESACLMLQALVEQAGKPPATLHIHVVEGYLPLLQSLTVNLPLAVHAYAGDPLRQWLTAIPGTEHETGSITPRSLLQHDLAQPVFGAAQWLSWRRVALLLLALAAVQLIGQQIRWAQLRSERAELRTQSASLLKTAFPATTTILDAPLQMERALADLRVRSNQSDPDDFTALVSAVGGIFSDAPINAFRGMEFGNGGEARSLRLTLSPGVAANPPEQETLRQRAAAAGYELRFEAAAQTGTSMTASPAGKSRVSGVTAILRTKGAS